MPLPCWFERAPTFAFFQHFFSICSAQADDFDEDEVALIFGEVDLDQSGYLDVHEIAELAKKLGRQVGHHVITSARHHIITSAPHLTSPHLTWPRLASAEQERARGRDVLDGPRPLRLRLRARVPRVSQHGHASLIS